MRRVQSACLYRKDDVFGLTALFVVKIEVPVDALVCSLAVRVSRPCAYESERPSLELEGVCLRKLGGIIDRCRLTYDGVVCFNIWTESCQHAALDESDRQMRDVDADP